MENKKKENVVYFKDLLFVVFYQWKKLVIAALILALALGGYKFVTGWRAINDPATLENNMQQNEIMTERHTAQVNALTLLVETLRENLQSQQTYMDNSLLMALDPYNYYEAKATFYVDTEYQILPGMEYQNPDKTAAVLNAYRTLLTGSDNLQDISDAVNTEPLYLREILSVSSSEDVLSITVSSANRSDAQKLIDLLIAKVQELHDEIAQTVDTHTATLIETSVRMNINQSLVTAQEKETYRLNEISQSLSDTQFQLLTLEAPVAQATSSKDVIKQAIKFAIVGGVAGVMAVAFVALFIHLVSSKVYSARVLTSRTCVKVLACLNTVQPKNPVDRWLRKLEGRSAADVENQLDLMAANIRNRFGNIRTLMVTGSIDSQDRADLVEALQQRLPEVQITNGSNLLNNACTLNALCSCDGVLLVEKCNESRYNDISQQADVIVEYEKTLLGCVLYGG